MGRIHTTLDEWRGRKFNIQNGFFLLKLFGSKQCSRSQIKRDKSDHPDKRGKLDHLDHPDELYQPDHPNQLDQPDNLDSPQDEPCATLSLRFRLHFCLHFFLTLSLTLSLTIPRSLALALTLDVVQFRDDATVAAVLRALSQDDGGATDVLSRAALRRR